MSKPATVAHDVSGAPEEFAGPVNILVVDDDPKNLLALEAILATLGERLFCAQSGEEALRQLLHHDFALILLDVQMPQMDGFETALRIRERERTRLTPIIFITAISKEDSHIFRGYSTGAVDYVFKPIEPEILRCKVAAFVSLYRKTEEVKRHAAELARVNAKLESANKELDQLYGRVRELDQLKSRFFANVSHELRTPLSLILGPTEKLLSEGKLGEQERDGLEVVERNARVLMKRVNELLEVAKLEAGKVELRYSEVDLAGLVRLTAGHFSLLAHDRNLQFSVEAPESLAAQVDEEKVQRILLNLLSNAFKFTPPGGHVTCRLQPVAARAVILVQDSGPGVPPRLREVIFERFRQGEAGETSASGGTGLGLAISKEFAELQKGAIWVQDAPGGGALFRLELPLAAPPGTVVNRSNGLPARRSEMAIEALAELSVRDSQVVVTVKDARPSVLVVEDHPEMARFIGEILSEEYLTEVARDGEEGLRKALEMRPDLIVADVMMPRMTGDQMLVGIRQCPQLNGTPIVMLTAKADDDLRIDLLRSGAQDYILKPFSTEELRARVRNLIQVKLLRDLLQNEITSQERDVIALVRDLLASKDEAEKALNQAQRAEEQLQSYATQLEERVAQRTAALQEMNADLEGFAYTVAHDLRAPLRSMMGFTQALLREYGPRLDERGREYAQRVIASVQRMDALTHDLLAYCSLSRTELPVASTRLADIVQEAVESLSEEVERTGAVIEVKVRRGFSVLAHRTTLLQVATNLLANALKFVAPGSTPKVLIWAEDAHGTVRLWVEDQGIGIDPAHHARIFGVFERLHAAEDYPGTGIGLAVVQKGTQRMGGQVGVESSPGRGSKFWVELPIGKEHHEESPSHIAG